MTVPYIARRKDSHGRIEEITAFAHFLPQNLEIEGRVTPETRKRGIYEVTRKVDWYNLAGFRLPRDGPRVS